MAMTKTAKKLGCILLILVCCLPLVSYDNRQLQTAYQSVACPYPLRQLSMYSDQTGWALTLANEILFTKDGIEHFETVKTFEYINTSSDRSASAAFLDSQTAYVAYYSSDDNQLIVEQTWDSGASWQQTQIDFTDYAEMCDVGYLYLSFANDKEGYLLCCSTPALGLMTKLLFRTNDAGNTFFLAADLTDDIAGYPTGITAVNSTWIDIAVTYHDVDSYLYQSYDCAKTWTSASLFPRTNDIHYIDGYAPIFYGNDRQKGILLLKIVKETAVYSLFTTQDSGHRWLHCCEIPCSEPISCSVGENGQIYVIDQSGTLFTFCLL